ncbi:MAG: hypothetical protein ACJARK_001722 [Marinobacter psychrophilus]|jgi:hypothetical protein
MKKVITPGMAILLTGCAAANISSQVRASGLEHRNLTVVV